MHKSAILFILFLLLAFNAGAQETESAERYFRESVAFLQRGNLNEALRNVNKAIELDPKLLQAYFLRASIYSKKGGEDEKVLADYTTIIALAPTAPGAELAYFNRAMILLRKGEIDAAARDVDKAILLKPEEIVLYQGRAVIRFQKRDYEGALADYERILAKDPNFIGALLGRGYFRYQKADFDGAFADFDRAVKVYPEYASAIINRGVVQGLKGNIAEAIIDFKKAIAIKADIASDAKNGNFSTSFGELNEFIALHPKNARAYQVRAIFRLFQNKEAEAEADFRQSVELDAALKSDPEKIREQFRKR